MPPKTQPNDQAKTNSKSPVVDKSRSNSIKDQPKPAAPAKEQPKTPAKKEQPKTPTKQQPKAPANDKSKTPAKNQPSKNGNGQIDSTSKSAQKSNSKSDTKKNDAKTVTSGPDEYQVSFKMLQEVCFGQRICVIGNNDALGNWQDFRAQMEWTEGHVWKTPKLKMNANSSDFEYKYVIMDGDHPGKWENGENRKADLKSLSAKQKNSSNIEIVSYWDDHVVDRTTQGQTEGGSPLPEKSREQKLESLKQNPMLLKQYLENYSASFSKDIDVLWDTHDLDKNGYLDRKEAKTYLDEIYKIIDKDRAQNYDKAKFDELFDRFDENGDQFLSKSEMSVLIKKVFKKPGPPNAFKGKPSVVYLEQQERPESLCLMMSYAGVKYDLKATNQSEINKTMGKYEGMTPRGQNTEQTFGPDEQTLLLECDSQVYTQEVAILRMMGMRYGYYTLTDPKATWDADFCIQKINDIWNYEALEKKDDVMDFPPNSKQVKKSTEALKKVCKIFNDKLGSQGKKFLGGSEPHIGDFYVYGFLSSRCINAKYSKPDEKSAVYKAITEGHPFLEIYVTNTFPKLPQVKNLNSDQSQPKTNASTPTKKK